MARVLERYRNRATACCTIAQQPVSQLSNGWSRVILVHQIESDLWRRQGAALTNFSTALPPTESALATQVLKDPYLFDFLSITHEHDERATERDLVAHITQFLVELGAGFAYVGQQRRASPLPTSRGLFGKRYGTRLVSQGCTIVEVEQRFHRFPTAE
jgi:predicted nuclease of restriction endonuclease-like (RecB) superfamily